MSTMTGNMRRLILSGLVGAVIALAAGGARADVASDEAAAILIFPKIVVDTSGIFGPPTDTELQITNTSNSVVSVRCYLVDATSRCDNAPTRACTAETEANASTRRCPLGGNCIPGWSETDFKMTLTKRQPIAWKASDGLAQFPCENGGCFGGQSNQGSDGSPSAILPTGDDPFFGELKCIEVSPENFAPTTGFNPANDGAGDLKGEATLIATAGALATDARKYNAIGIQSTGLNNGDDDLVIGGPGAEYNGCPNVLIVNHFFDNATIVTHGGQASGQVVTDLTFVPCSEDFLLQENNLGGATLQFLVFNEFEQRFSTSTSFTCWAEVQISDIDTRPGPFGNNNSIFNVGLQGTLAGQTRIRPVEGSTRSNAVVAIAEEFWQCTSGPSGTCTTASNVHFTGNRINTSDHIFLTPQP